MNYNFVTNLAHLWQFVVGSKGRKKTGSVRASLSLIQVRQIPFSGLGEEIETLRVAP